MKRITKFQGLNEMITSFCEYKGMVGVGELSRIPQNVEMYNDEEEVYFPDALLIMDVVKGSARVHLDYISYEINANSLMLVLPIHIFKIVQTSPDFKGKLLVMQKAFVEECSCANSHLSVSNYMALRKTPYLPFAPGESIYLRKCLDDIKTKIELKSHAFHKDVVYNSFCSFALELAHLMTQRQVAKKVPMLSRKEDLVNQFFKLILRYCKEEHTTGFYADKLCITPQYLSSILKNMTGKPANQWINDALITEAKIQLKRPQVTVQEVAYTLNFSDQSSFGKFFKKGIGLSPSQYRLGAVS